MDENGNNPYVPRQAQYNPVVPQGYGAPAAEPTQVTPEAVRETPAPTYGNPKPVQEMPEPAKAVSEHKKAPSWAIPVVIIVALLALMVWSVSSCTSSLVNGVGSFVHSSTPVATQRSVAIITLGGEIAYDGSVCSPEGFKAMLDKAQADPLIEAVVLRVNSGGGTATAGEEMTTYLANFNKPVVVSCAATNASAAYMISSQADYIYTSKSSAVGAIGVAMQLIDYSGLMNLLGITTENITSADSKDSTYGTRGLTEEERAEYQHQVDQINEVFIDFVSEGRHMSKDSVRALATGMTYTGLDAVSNGLADKIGTLDDACAKAASLAGMPAGYDVVYLEQKSMSLGSLLGLDVSRSSSSQELVVTSKELR